MTQIVRAWCAGREVDVAVKPSPPDDRRVACPSCGAKRGDECVEIGSGHLLYRGHAARRAAAERLFGGAKPV